MSSDTFVDILKQQLNAAQYFGLSGDDYLNNLNEIYLEHFAKSLSDLAFEIRDKHPDLAKETLNNLIQDIYRSFDSNLQSQLRNMEDFLANGVFKIPSYVQMAENETLNLASSKFSPEQNEEIDNRLKEMVTSLRNKQAYMNQLQKKLNELKRVNQILDLSKH